MNYLEQQQYCNELVDLINKLTNEGNLEGAERVQETLTRQYL